MNKFSFYNISVAHKDGLIIYNTVSSAVLLLNRTEKEAYVKAVNNCSPDLLPSQLLEALVKGNMIIPYASNELESLELKYKLETFSSPILGLTIAPTLACNFSCPYCYENGKRQNTMNNEVIKQIVKFIDFEMKTKRSLFITWYGGEPLLATDVIDQITQYIQKKNYNYHADMVTNGYLLNKTMAQKLKKLNITRVQVSLDGLPETHNSTRFLANGCGTFDTVIKNISEACHHLDIVIRVNVNKNNIFEIPKLLDIFDTFNLAHKVRVYLAPIEKVNENCITSHCIDSIEFSKMEYDLFYRYSSRGYFDFKIPIAHCASCGAAQLNAYIIDPKGDIYKCWDEIGEKENCIGSIFTGYNGSQNLTKWLNFNPFVIPKCKACKLLPICVGGCPRLYIQTKDCKCISLRYSIKNYLNFLTENS